MGSGFHNRCSLTRTCGDYENNHYYYKSQGLHLRKTPEEWADKVAWEHVSPRLQKLEVAADRAIEGRVGGVCPGEEVGRVAWPGGLS